MVELPKIGIYGNTYFLFAERNNIVEDLISVLVANGKLNIVSRKRIDVIMREQDFNLSGYVSDESAQSIGRL